MSEISGGQDARTVPVTLNKMVFDYDHLLICGPVFPHEVVGFSGGHKYLFPGIAAPEIINFTHWLGALITNPVINGTRDTPVRAAIEAAADMVPVERQPDRLRGRWARRCAACSPGRCARRGRPPPELSDQLHIIYRDQPYQTVLSCAPKMYDDIWTAGKCMYKLEPVVADGGTLIIYAPHIDEVSYSHGKVLDEIGYHVPRLLREAVGQVQGVPLGRAGPQHARQGRRHVRERRRETPRVNVVLATRIPRETVPADQPRLHGPGLDQPRRVRRPRSTRACCTCRRPARSSTASGSSEENGCHRGAGVPPAATTCKMHAPRLPSRWHVPAIPCSLVA